MLCTFFQRNPQMLVTNSKLVAKSKLTSNSWTDYDLNSSLQRSQFLSLLHTRTHTNTFSAISWINYLEWIALIKQGLLFNYRTINTVLWQQGSVRLRNVIVPRWPIWKGWIISLIPTINSHIVSCCQAKASVNFRPNMYQVIYLLGCIYGTVMVIYFRRRLNISYTSKYLLLLFCCPDLSKVHSRRRDS
jgi:hypothetical protein